MLFSGWKDYSWETISTDVQSGEGRTNNQDTCLNSIIDNHNTGWDCKDDLKLFKYDNSKIRLRRLSWMWSLNGLFNDLTKKKKKELVFATSSNFLISISLESDGVNLWYFKLRLIDLTEFIVWNLIAKI